MYKIFINEKVILLSDSTSFITSEKVIKRLKFESDKTIEEALSILNTQSEITGVLICHNNLTALLEEFKANFKIIEAAGGLVKNNKGEVLFIFRFGKWDLPKGKIEKGESIKNAAIREVEEECGIRGLEIVKPLLSTYHIYELKGDKILKRTYWLEMICTGSNELNPQTEEGITEAKWLDKKGIDNALKNTYQSIKEVLKSEESMKY